MLTAAVPKTSETKTRGVDSGVVVEKMVDVSPAGKLQVLLVFGKNSEEYKLACQYFLEVKQLEKSIKDCLIRIINEDEEDELVLPLKKAQIDVIPNFLDESIEISQYERCVELLHDFAKEKKLDAEIVVPYFESMLREERGISDRVALTLTSVLLLQAYRPGSQRTKNAIKAFLSGEDAESFEDRSLRDVAAFGESNTGMSRAATQILQDLATPLTSLRWFLHHAEQQLRLQARGIVEALRLPLELHEMISLSIDGVECASDNQTDDMVLVVGTSGCGKSTLINYAVGVEYECIEDHRLGITYLQPKPGQDVPAKVGHSAKSETLYPLLIQGKVTFNRQAGKTGALESQAEKVTKAFAYVDTPGFDDNRESEEAICAALGVPLSIRHTNNKIRAVIVVVTWSMTEVNARENVKAFRSLAKTLGNIIKEPEVLLKQREGFPVPLIFAVSKPPQPKRGQIFKTEKLRRQLGERIAEIKSSREETYKGLAVKKSRLVDLQKEVDMYCSCLIELGKLDADFHEEDGGDSWRSKASKGVASWFVGTQTIEKGQQEILIKSQKEQWEQEQISLECIKRLEEVLRNIFSAREKKTEKTEKLLASKAIIKSCKKLWERTKAEREQERDTLQLDVDEIESERQILDFMARSADNVFMIRGYQDDKKDELDHREALLCHLQRLRDEDVFISQEHFNFNAQDNNFEKVRTWAQDFAVKMRRPLQGLLAMPAAIDIVDKNVKMVEDEIKEKEYSLALELRTDPTAAAAQLNGSIISKKSEISKIEQEIMPLEERISSIKERIKDINQASPMKYHSEEKQLTAPGWWNIFDWSGAWTYTFLGEVPKPTFANQNRSWWDTWRNVYPDGTYVIPIEKVELDVRNGHFQEAAQNDHSTGKYSVTCYPNDNSNEVTKATVRVFVLPKNIPNFRFEIERLQNEMTRKIKEVEQFKKRLDDLNKKISVDEQELDLRRRGLYRQAEKVTKIKGLVIELGYTRETFLEKFCLEVRSHMTWLAEPENFKILQSFLKSTEQQAEETLGIPRQLLPGFIGQPPANQNKQDLGLSDDICNELFAQVGKKFFKDMYVFAKETGLTLESFFEIMKYLDSVFVENITLPEKLLVQRVCRAREQYLFESLQALYRSYYLKIRALDEVIKLFDLGSSTNRTEIIGYLEDSQKLKEQGILDRCFSSIDSSILNDVTNSLFDNYVQIDTWKKCDEYGVSVEHLRSRSGKTKLERSSDGSFARTLERRNMQLYKSIKDGDLARVVKLLDGYLELATGIRPMVCDPNKVQEPALFMLVRLNKVNWLKDERVPLRLNVTDEQGNGALHKAAELGRVEFGAALIGTGIVDLKAPPSQIWPKNQQGQTPFHIAAIHGETDLIIQWVEQYKAEDALQSLTNTGDSILHLLVAHNGNDRKDRLITLLKKYPCLAAYYSNNAGKDPLYLAVECKKEELAIALLDHAAVDLANRDNQGRTALHVAVRHDLLLVVQKLIQKGADLRITDYNNQTAEDCAQQDSKVCIWLKEKRRALDVKRPPSRWCNLVFQGGGVKGFAYAGALRALIDEELCGDLTQFRRVAGTSAGAITALVVGLGYNLDEIDHITGVKSLNGSNLPQVKFQELLDGEWGKKLQAAVKKKEPGLLIGLEQDHYKAIEYLRGIDTGFGSIIGNFPSIVKAALKAGEVAERLKKLYEQLEANGFGLCPGDELLKLFEKLIIAKLNQIGLQDPVNNITFRELSNAGVKMEMYFVGVNIEKGEPEIFSKETTPDMVVSNAVRISMSIPGVFKPCHKVIKRDGKLQQEGPLYVDGGLLWNYPIDIFDTEGCVRGSEISSEPQPRINHQTLGLRLVSQQLKAHYERGEDLKKENITMFWQYIQNVGIALTGNEEANHARQENQFRSIYIDTMNVGTLNFEQIDEPEVKVMLTAQGRQGVLAFKSRVRFESSQVQLPRDLRNICLRYLVDPEDVDQQDQHKKYRPHPELVLAFYKYPDPRLHTFLQQEFGVSLLSRDELGNTAFHIAAKNGEIQALERLLKVQPKGATMKNHAGEKPIFMAQKRSISDLLESYQISSDLMVLHQYRAGSDDDQPTTPMPKKQTQRKKK